MPRQLIETTEVCIKWFWPCTIKSGLNQSCNTPGGVWRWHCMNVNFLQEPPSVTPNPFKPKGKIKRGDTMLIIMCQVNYITCKLQNRYIWLPKCIYSITLSNNNKKSIPQSKKKMILGEKENGRIKYKAADELYKLEYHHQTFKHILSMLLLPWLYWHSESQSLIYQM